MKRIMTLALAAGLVFGVATGASAVDFEAKGQWIFGFGIVNSAFVTKEGARRTPAASSDKFAAVQRLRLQMEAVASESLSGTVQFEIGDTTWGQAGAGNSVGGTLGADGISVEVRAAYLDWAVPHTDVKFRMGIQGMAFPSVAGGPAIFDEQGAGIVANYRINDNVGLTALWIRAYNDNTDAFNINGNGRFVPAGYLDNMDIFAITVPVTVDGFTMTPWVSVGMQGKYTEAAGRPVVAERAVSGMLPYTNVTDVTEQNSPNFGRHSYRSLFWAGLPIAYTGLDPWNFELDINYGHADSFMRYSVLNQRDDIERRASTMRQGWVIKGLAEYKMDWATPGLFAWYGSGDDSSVKNGSERMPVIAPSGNFTSFMGDGDERGWSLWSGDWNNPGYDIMLSYSGTWGLGLQLKQMSCMEGLTHTFKAAYWGGTNSPEMVKYLPATGFVGGDGVYLTTNDALVEFNVDSTYKIYENLAATLELGYIINGIDQGTWQRSYTVADERFRKGDAYKAALIFDYSF